MRTSLSSQCELALFDASRNVQQTMQRIARVAEAFGAIFRRNARALTSIVQCISANARKPVSALPSRGG
jgi:hypothetical protein